MIELPVDHVEARRRFAAIPKDSARYIYFVGVGWGPVLLGLIFPEGATAVMGRAQMVDQLLDLIVAGPDSLADFKPNTSEDKLRDGLLGAFRDVPVIRLRGDGVTLAEHEMLVCMADGNDIGLHDQTLQDQTVGQARG